MPVAPTSIALQGALVCDGSAPPTEATVVIEGATIRAVQPARAAAPLPPDARVLDLRGHLLVPGLIDVHTHLLSGGDTSTGAYDRELLKDSLPLRTLRAAAHARMAIDHGFLTMRDVCTEGAAFADVALRDAVAAGLCEGPRILPSGPGIGITGGYLPTGFAPGVCVPSGCALVDGADAARREVRLPASHGVAWIKVFADWFYVDPTTGGSVDRPTFTRGELDAIVDEAKRRGLRVAAHATSDAGARQAIACGVASIEHLGPLTGETLDAAAAGGVVLVPTLSVLEHGLNAAVDDKRRARSRQRMDTVALSFARALASGVRIACGTDIGCYPHASGSMSEVRLMIELGMAPLDALRAATAEGAALLGLPDIGRIAEGATADLCAFPLDRTGADLAATLIGSPPSFVVQGGRLVRGG